MDASQVVFSEQALSLAANAVASYQGKMKKALEETINRIQALECNWDDEDHRELLRGLSSLKSDSADIEVGVVQLVSRIRRKLEAIEQLHNMKI